jgi:hypothetical protein
VAVGGLVVVPLLDLANFSKSAVLDFISPPMLAPFVSFPPDLASARGQRSKMNINIQ